VGRRWTHHYSGAPARILPTSPAAFHMAGKGGRGKPYTWRPLPLTRLPFSYPRTPRCNFPAPPARCAWRAGRAGGERTADDGAFLSIFILPESSDHQGLKLWDILRRGRTGGKTWTFRDTQDVGVTDGRDTPLRAGRDLGVTWAWPFKLFPRLPDIP